MQLLKNNSVFLILVFSTYNSKKQKISDSRLIIKIVTFNIYALLMCPSNHWEPDTHKHATY